MAAVGDDDRNRRKVYVNGFAAGSLMETDLVDYFGLLFGGHVRGAWIDRKFGTHAVVEFDEEEWAKKAVEKRKHYVGEDGLVVFAWKSTKGTFSKRSKKRERTESGAEVDEEEAGRKSMKNEGERTRNDSRRMEAFSLKALRDSLRIDRDEGVRRRRMKEDLEKRIAGVGVWPRNSKLVLFGSSVNGFGWRNSDIDLSLLIDFDGATRFNGHATDPKSADRPISPADRDDQNRLTVEEYGLLDSKAKLELLASCLREVDPSLISDIVQIHGRRCPVIRFSYRGRENGPWNRCEISIDNQHAVKNTRWLERVNEKYEWLPLLYSAFRWWISRWREMETVEKELNGYTIALILIAYCQRRGLIDWEWDQNEKESRSCSPNHQLDEASLADLFHEFTSALHTTHWKQTVFSPALRGADQPIAPILDFLKSGRHNDLFQFSCMNVQDPFDNAHNTACRVSEESVKRLAMISTYWKKKIERGGKEQVWTSFSDSRMDPDTEGEGTGPVFVCEPSADTLLALSTSSNEEVGARWCEIAIKAVLEIFADVLKIRVAEEDASSGKFYCLAWNATWLAERRKVVSKKIVEKEKDFGVGVRSRLELEKKISETMIAEEGEKVAGSKKKKKAKIEPVAEFSLTLTTLNGDGYQEARGWLEGEKHLNVFGKFLTDFVHLVFEDAVRKVMSAGD